MFPVVETIEKRCSVRTYARKPLSQKLVKEICEYVKKLNETEGPFLTKPRFFIASAYFENNPIGTYGIIKNASDYMVGVTKRDFKHLIDFGYNFEKLILFMTSIGLGTCWLAGTFNRDEFMEKIELSENEYIPAITPVGYSNQRLSIVDQSLRIFAQSNKRNDWQEMFFEEDFLHPIKKEACNGIFHIPIEMVRLAPSGMNKQPWIIVLKEKEKCAHFYSRGSSTHLMDMGIAMCHFELACNEKGIYGAWEREEDGIDNKYEYIVSFKWV